MNHAISISKIKMMIAFMSFQLLLIVMEFFYQENNYYTIPRQVLLVNKLPLSIVTYVEAADRYVLYFQPDVTLVFLYDGKKRGYRFA